LQLKKKRMIKPVLILLLAFTSSSTLCAQYYYNDIVNNKQVLAELALLKEKKINGVKVISLEATGEESEGFTCQKKINRDFTEMEIYTETNESYPNTFISYFTKAGLLQRTVDSSEAGATTIDYTYDAAGRLVFISSSKRFNTEDDAGILFEQHHYKYNDAGVLLSMTLIKNKRDTTLIEFKPDETGNAGIEKNTRTGEVYYYYHNSRNQLTEILHQYNPRKNPFTEYTFEYNEAGQLARMRTIEKEGADYFTWRYDYEDGLRINERCYSKQGGIIGSVEYKYK
jgi:YD repeat-containing protein